MLLPQIFEGIGSILQEFENLRAENLSLWVINHLKCSCFCFVLRCYSLYSAPLFSLFCIPPDFGGVILIDSSPSVLPRSSINPHSPFFTIPRKMNKKKQRTVEAKKKHPIPHTFSRLAICSTVICRTRASPISGSST